MQEVGGSNPPSSTPGVVPGEQLHLTASRASFGPRLVAFAASASPSGPRSATVAELIAAQPLKPCDDPNRLRRLHEPLADDGRKAVEAFLER